MQLLFLHSCTEARAGPCCPAAEARSTQTYERHLPELEEHGAVLLQRVLLPHHIAAIQVRVMNRHGETGGEQGKRGNESGTWCRSTALPSGAVFTNSQLCTLPGSADWQVWQVWRAPLPALTGNMRGSLGEVDTSNMSPMAAAAQGVG